jgi:hypothetical protein
MPQYPASSPAGALGNPATREDGTVEGLSAPIPATPATAALARPVGHDERLEAAYRGLDARLPQGVSVADQARAADGNFGRNHAR